MNLKELTTAITALQRSIKTRQGGKSDGHAGLQASTTAMLRKLAGAPEILQAAKQALRQQAVELTTVRQQYQDLFESAPDGYLITNAKGVIPILPTTWRSSCSRSPRTNW